MTQQISHQTSSERTGWAGWVMFAGFMLGLSGVFHFIAGLVALFHNSVYLVNNNQLVVLNYDQWGWAHMLLGIVLVLAAMALASGKLWGRIMGVTVAVLSAAANFLFLQAYPLWSIMIIAIDILVIYSIIVHGSELSEDNAM